MTKTTEVRINQAAARLAKMSDSGSAENRRDHSYVRSTKALDPDRHKPTVSRRTAS